MPPLPNFLIIGAQKAGTRWLRHNLGAHPEVFAAENELSYFNTSAYRRGPDWYRAQFRDWSGERAVGESTPGYTMPRQRPARNADRIDALLTDVRLFVVLRDPCERALSAFIHHMGEGRLDPGTDLLEYVASQPPDQERFQLVAGGRYAANLQPFRDRFGERLLVFLNEEVSGDPRGVYRRCLAHLAVDRDFVPGRLEQVRFSNSTPRSSRYAGRGRGRRPLSVEERARLHPYFADDIAQLEQLLERDLSAWGPQPGLDRTTV